MPTQLLWLLGVNLGTFSSFYFSDELFFSYQPQSQQQTPCKHHLQSFPHQPQFHPVLQNNSTMHQSQHAGPYSQNTQSGPPSHLSEISHAHQPISMSQHMTCLQPLSGGHVGGRLHMMVSLFDRFSFIKQGERFCNSICLLRVW